MPGSATRSCAVWSTPARSKRSRSTPTDPSPAPIRTSRRPSSMTTNAKPPTSLASRSRQGLRPGPARRRHRLGQDRGLFRSDRRMPAPGQAGARPAARNRADRALPQALRRPLRLRAGRLAFGPALVAAPPRLAGDRQRRGAGHGRRPLGLVPALPKPRPDRRRRGARAELQAGGRRPVSRPRRGGDARQVRGDPGHPRPRRRRRSRAGTWSRSAAIAKSHCPSASPARRMPEIRAIDLTQDPPPRGRWLAPALVARARGESRARASSRCSSSTAAASRR